MVSEYVCMSYIGVAWSSWMLRILWTHAHCERQSDGSLKMIICKVTWQLSRLSNQYQHSHMGMESMPLNISHEGTPKKFTWILWSGLDQVVSCQRPLNYCFWDWVTQRLINAILNTLDNAIHWVAENMWKLHYIGQKSNDHILELGLIPCASTYISINYFIWTE